jgi:hypothetical protein
MAFQVYLEPSIKAVMVAMNPAAAAVVITAAAVVVTTVVLVAVLAIGIQGLSPVDLRLQVLPQHQVPQSDFLTQLLTTLTVQQADLFHLQLNLPSLVAREYLKQILQAWHVVVTP